MIAKLSLAAMVGGFVALAAADASALPATPQHVGSPATITLAAGGCGPGWHRGPYGACLPGGYGYGYGGPRCWVRPTPYGPRRVCRW